MWSYPIFFMIHHKTDDVFFIIQEFHVILISDDIGFRSLFFRFLEFFVILVPSLILVLREVWSYVSLLSTLK